MTELAPAVYVVDDDESVRRSLERLLRCNGYQVETFASAQEFLDHYRPNSPGCLVLDVQMEGLDGFKLQEALNKAHAYLPIVFITGHGTILMSVDAMKAGAVDFLTKPFAERDLLVAIDRAIAKNKEEKIGQEEISRIRQRVGLLTSRECDVLGLVVCGLLNKQIGLQLGITEKTVKVHRGHVMRKMSARSLAELVHMADRIGYETGSFPVEQPVTL